MSLILDALRKMEQERKSRRGAGLVLSEVLRYRAAVKESPGRPYLLATAGLLLLAAGVGAGVLLKSGAPAGAASGAGVTASSAQPEPGREVTYAAPPAATGSAPSAAPAAAPAVVPADAQPPAGAGLATHRDQAPADQKPAASAAVARSSAKLHRSEAPRERREAAGGAQAKTAQRESVGDGAALPEITISGIAWQDERNLRRAVLNGTLVGEGAEVAGARVVEIRENRVRLSRNGQIFDVVFSSGLSSR